MLDQKFETLLKPYVRRESNSVGCVRIFEGAGCAQPTGAKAQTSQLLDRRQ